MTRGSPVSGGCAACGAASPEGARFCMECGAPLEAACERCGTLLPPAAKFCPECGVAAKPTGSDSRDAAAEKSGVRGGERRHLTVLFADLVDSTRMADRLDPEDMRDVLRMFQQHCGEVVAARGGHVARYMGDGVLIYFGYPRAEEDSATQAVRASLEITAGVSELIADQVDADGAAPNSLSARVGIHAGTVFVGEMGHGERVEEADVVGDTPNIAARLQSLARPGEVVMSAGVRSIVADEFESTSLGTHELKGIGQPVEVFRADRPKASGRYMLPLIGRDVELDVIAEQWAAVNGGAAEVVVVSGEPGVGKSRLIHAAAQRLEVDDRVRIELQCEESQQHTAFGPITRLVRQELELSIDEPDDAVRRTLAAECGKRGLDPAEVVPFLATMFGLGADDAFSLPEISAEGRRTRLIEIVATWLTSAIERRPLLVLVDDLHWADSSTCEVLERIRSQEQERSTGALFLFSSRHSALPVSIRPLRATSVLLPRLDEATAGELLASAVGDDALSREELLAIVRASEGIPLYIEQFGRGVAEARTASGSAAIPITLQDSLMARLDRLGDARDVAQTASVLGREFVVGVIERMAPEIPALRQQLDALVTAGVLQRSDSPYGLRFRFTHSLMERASYESMLRSRRKELHRRAMASIDAEFPDLRSREPAVLAHHHERAGDVDEAVGLFFAAAQQHAARYAQTEAGSLARRALDLLQRLPVGAARDRREMELLAIQLNAIHTESGYADPSAVPVQDRYLEVADRVGDPLGGVIAQIYIASRHMSLGESTRSISSSQAMVERAEKLGIPYLELSARSVQSGCCAMAAGYRETIEAAEHGLLALEKVDHPFPAAVTNPAYLCTAAQGLALWAVGEPDRAIAVADRGVAFRFGDGVADPQGVGVSLLYRAWLHLLAENLDEACEDADAALRLGHEQGVAWLQWSARVFAAIARVRRDRPPGLDPELVAAVEEYNPRSGPTVRYLGNAELARSRARAGEHERALELLRDLRRNAADNGGAFCEEELFAAEVEILLDLGDLDAARQVYRSGRDLVEARGAHGWALRLGVSLSRHPATRPDAVADLAESLARGNGTGSTVLEQTAQRIVGE